MLIGESYIPLIEEAQILINTNYLNQISAEHKHRLNNIGKENYLMINLQSGGYLIEEDFMWFKNLCGRA